MGTRSTTKIYRDGKLILAFYKQFDGYTNGWGQSLKDFLKKGVFVNGFNATKGKIQFNGIEDFALLLVKEFKVGTGELYATTENDKQEYNYIIEFNHDKSDFNKVRLIIKCLEDDSFYEKQEINLI